MPTLKQLTCRIKWTGCDVELKEYQPTYGDGFVHSYIAVPPFSTPFYIQLTSCGFIAPGLAMFVYIDGEYQCNRNRCNLRTADEAAVNRQTEVDFVVRQQEKPVRGGHFLAKEWRFKQAGMAGPGGQFPSMPHTTACAGLIEVVVLRCYTQGSMPRRRAIPSTPSTVTDIELSSEDERSPESSADNARLDGAPSDNPTTLYNSADDSLLNPAVNSLCGGDGTWDGDVQWDGSRNQDSGALGPVGPPQRGASMGNPSTKAMSFNQNHSAQPSPAIVINVNQPLGPAAGTTTPGSRLGPSDSRAPSATVMPDPRDNMSQNTWGFKEAQNGRQPISDPNQTDNYNNGHGHWNDPTSTADLGANDYGDGGGQAEGLGDNDDDEFETPSQPNDENWDNGNTQHQGNDSGWDDTNDNAEMNDVESQHRNNSFQENDNSWQGNEAQGDIAGWNNDDAKPDQGTAKTNNGGHGHAFNEDAHAEQWQQGQDGGYGQAESNTGYPDPTELESRSQLNPHVHESSYTEVPHLGHPIPPPFTNNYHEAYVQPYWSSWNEPSPVSDTVLIEEDDVSLDSRDSDSTQADRIHGDGRGQSNLSGADDLMGADSSTTYIHKVGRPRYMDTHQNPYAVFAFSYRSYGKHCV